MINSDTQNIPWMIILFFSSFIILLTKFSCNFNGDILCLDLSVCAFVVLGVLNTTGSGVVSPGAGSSVGIMCGYFLLHQGQIVRFLERTF